MPYALATLEHQGQILPCLEVHGRFFPLSGLPASPALPDSVVALFEDWPHHDPQLERLAGTCPPDGGLASADVRLLAPLRYPGKILCAGANYYDHLAEMGMPGAKKEDQRLFFFMKPPRNAVVGPGATVHMPIGTQAFDWEIELAAVIGRTARNVSVEDALSHVAAYTVAIDFSARDHNRAPETFYKLDWVAGKANDTCCPLGPRLVPAQAVGQWPAQAGRTFEPDDFFLGRTNRHGLAHHDPGPWRPAADRHAGRCGRAQADLFEGGRPGGCRDRRHRTPECDHTSVLLKD